jgi:hypothetical protein
MMMKITTQKTKTRRKRKVVPSLYLLPYSTPCTILFGCTKAVEVEVVR